MADSESFEFDAALSFLSIDEGLAVQLNDLLQDRFRTFLYSKRQEVLAGADGEEAFNAVFAKQSRVVVVFYRKEWGETPFTRIEQTAIRNRAFEKGYEFTLFVPTETPPNKPEWLPKTRLYYGLTRFGMEGLAATVENRIQEMGGDPKIESIPDTASRVQRAIALKEAQRQFRRGNGPSAASAAYEDLLNALAKGLVEMAKAGTAFRFQEPKRWHNSWLIFDGHAFSMTVIWNRQYSNDLEGSGLDVRIFRGHPQWPGVIAFDPPTQLAAMLFDFELLAMNRAGYVQRHSSSNRTYSADELAEHILRSLMETVARKQ